MTVARSASDPQPATPVDAFVARRVLILSNVLRRAAALRYRRLLDISVGEWGALAELGLRAPCTLNELARGLALDKTRLSRTVSALERRGVVQRRVNPRDNRETLISLTKSGVRAYGRMIAAARATNDALLAPFSADERAQLEALVDRLALRAREILAHEQEGMLDSGR
ncbi:MAG: MarR family transcriptional regulator [Methylobacteriaceae bacterium]|nr:MarR family transcriptional regulator [Rhodoblastus sp.]MCC0006401.1 MarR family transcriptional regulator [Methylobacteriaceae bacterium]